MIKLTIEKFTEFIEELFQKYDFDTQFVYQVLCNDEWSSDEELLQYLTENGVDESLVKQLLTVREYFWDIKYVKNL